MSDYSEERLDVHSTMGDANERFQRDSDAFTAGVQFALDTMLNRMDRTVRIISPQSADSIESTATEILANVHDGRLW
jgi:hypothetical protein